MNTHRKINKLRVNVVPENNSKKKERERLGDREGKGRERDSSPPNKSTKQNHSHVNEKLDVSKSTECWEE